MIAARALVKNKLRAGLTVLGIVIGVGAVIALVSMGESAQSMVLEQFESIGTNMLLVFPGSQENGPVRTNLVVTLTPQDALAVENECESVLKTSPVVVTRAQVVYGNTNYSPREIYGVAEGYPLIRNWTIRRGAYFTDRDITSAAKVCVIGQSVVENLFQTTDPLGQTIRIKGVPFTVVGTLEPKGAGLNGQEQDSIILAPYTTVKKRLQGSTFNNIDMIMVAVKSRDRMSDAEREIKALLKDRHKIRPGELNDFTVFNTTEIARVLSIITTVMTGLLAAIASVSLIVGGVGIMNIMLVSVKERTREIGIRMAVGARGRDILLQFLIEAALLSLVGGAIGVMGGLSVSWLATTALNAQGGSIHWPWIVSLWPILLSLGFSAMIGLIFGLYPAYQASQLDPIEALRYE
ncbi:MAG: ABC transporter permease [Pirellulales bacterium]|nr:ABC transporter permease [Pirellulales bacterium]